MTEADEQRWASRNEAVALARFWRHLAVALLIHQPRPRRIPIAPPEKLTGYDFWDQPRLRRIDRLGRIIAEAREMITPCGP